MVGAEFRAAVAVAAAELNSLSGRPWQNLLNVDGLTSARSRQLATKRDPAHRGVSWVHDGENVRTSKCGAMPFF